MSTRKRSDKPNRKVLDAWAMLAWLKNQAPGAQKVRRALESAEKGQLLLLMNIVNLGEVYYLMAKATGLAKAEEFLQDFRSMPVRILPATNQLVLEAAALKARHAISYADGFALATAARRNAALLTGDPDLKPLTRVGPANIEWIG